MFEASASTCAAVGVEREREVLAVLDPEVAVEAPLEVGGLALEPVGERRVLPDRPGEPRAADLGVVGVALQLAGRAREARAAGRRGRRSSPRSPSSTGSRGRSPRCGAGTRCSRCPAGRRTRRSSRARRAPRTRARARASCRRSSARTRRAARRTAASRRRSRSTASAGAPRTRSSRRSASRAGSGPGSSSRKSSTRVPCRSPSSRSVVAASSGANGSACRLVKMLSRPNIVMNQGRPAAGRLRPAGDQRREPQRGEVDEAAPVRRLAAGPSRTRAAARRRASARGSAACSAAACVAGRTCGLRAARRQPGTAVTTSRSVVHSPCGSMCDREREPVLVDLGRLRRRDHGLAAERLALVPEDAAGRPRRACSTCPSSSSASLTSNRSAKSLPASMRTARSTGLSSWLRIVSVLVEAVADGALADHRQLGVDVDGAGARHEEEPGLEVLQVVGRQRVQPLAVDGQHPRATGSACRTRTGRSGRSATPRCRRASSLTTNVLPSRILTSPSLMTPSSRTRPLHGRRSRAAAPGAGAGTGR